MEMMPGLSAGGPQLDLMNGLARNPFLEMGGAGASGFGAGGGMHPALAALMQRAMLDGRFSNWMNGLTATPAATPAVPAVPAPPALTPALTPAVMPNPIPDLMAPPTPAMMPALQAQQDLQAQLAGLGQAYVAPENRTRDRPGALPSAGLATQATMPNRGMGY